MSGLYTIKAVSETEICVFCHTPHNTNPAQPLWNHTLSTQTYTLYTSESFNASSTIGQPNGYSRLCLSCHDGTVAIGSVQMLRGQVATGTISMQGVGGSGEMPTTTRARLGTDLTNDHPISFLFDSSLTTTDEELVDPSTLTGIIRLYPRNDTGIRDSVQCTSCHDPHNAGLAKFVKKSPLGQSDNLCMTCHSKRDWPNSLHQSSTLIPVATGVPVNTNACLNCHYPHNEGPPRLLRSSSPVSTPPGIEQTCYRCHNNDQPSTIPNIQDEFAKTYKMPIDSRSGHYIKNSNFFEDQTNLNTNRHVECTDCHNPHRVIKNTKYDGTGFTGPGNGTHSHSAPHSNTASGALTGMWGVEPTFGSAWTQPTSFTELKNYPNLVTKEYQVCLKCHSYYGFGNNPPTNFTSFGINGVTALTDQALELNPNNPAFHPVVQATGNTGRASGGFLSPFTVVGTQTMYCTDCHGPNVPGSGTTVPTPPTPNGPHGSQNPFILKGLWDRYTGNDPDSGAGIETSSHLCFKCHDYNVYAKKDVSPYNNAGYTNFRGPKANNLHGFHVFKMLGGANPFACWRCHSSIPHGWDYSRLIVQYDDSAPYNQGFANGGSKLRVINQKFGTNNWVDTDCGGPPSEGSGKSWMRTYCAVK